MNGMRKMSQQLLACWKLRFKNENAYAYMSTLTFHIIAFWPWKKRRKINTAIFTKLAKSPVTWFIKSLKENDCYGKLSQFTKLHLLWLGSSLVKKLKSPAAECLTSEKSSSKISHIKKVKQQFLLQHKSPAAKRLSKTKKIYQFDMHARRNIMQIQMKTAYIANTENTIYFL